MNLKIDSHYYYQKSWILIKINLASLSRSDEPLHLNPVHGYNILLLVLDNQQFLFGPIEIICCFESVVWPH